MRKNKKINIIYKDDQIVVCEKPKGIPVSSDKTGDSICFCRRIVPAIICREQDLQVEQLVNTVESCYL